MAAQQSHLTLVPDYQAAWEELKKRFVDAFGTRLVAAKNEGNWSTEARELACQYAKNLVHGDGKVPDKLQNPDIIDAVHIAFIETCHELHIAGLPGQRQKWFRQQQSQPTVGKPRAGKATTQKSQRRTPHRKGNSSAAKSA